MERTIYIAVIAIMCFGFVLGKVLSYLNKTTWKETLPDKLKDFYSKEEYQRAKNYHREHGKLGAISGLISFILMLCFFVFGGFGWVYDLTGNWSANEIIRALIFFGLLGFASDLLGMPFGIYSTFVIEEKYGFNKTTVKTYVLDKLKSYMLSIILGGGILALLIWLIQLLGTDFWLLTFVVIIGLSFFFNMFYTTLILPLFNKLTPLEQGELREAIEEFARKVNFPLTNIFVIDGSKRSSKANAYFSGFGKRKKIVLYDTLIEKHSTEELVAVLAHEVGHYKHKHIIKGFFSSALTTFIMLYLLSLFILNPDFTAAFYQNMIAGIQPLSKEVVLPINLIAFAILYEPISLIIGLLGNVLSRKHEFQADRFAVKHTSGNYLSKALRKMSVDHLSNLDPHPWYVFFHYSHPPLLQRLEAMENPKDV